MAISESLVTSVYSDNDKKTFLFMSGKLVYLCPCKVSHKCSSCLLLFKSEALIAFIEEIGHILDSHMA